MKLNKDEIKLIQSLIGLWKYECSFTANDWELKEISDLEKKLEKLEKKLKNE